MSGSKPPSAAADASPYRQDWQAEGRAGQRPRKRQHWQSSTYRQPSSSSWRGPRRRQRRSGRAGERAPRSPCCVPHPRRTWKGRHRATQRRRAAAAAAAVAMLSRWHAQRLASAAASSGQRYAAKRRERGLEDEVGNAGKARCGGEDDSRRRPRRCLGAARGARRGARTGPLAARAPNGCASLAPATTSLSASSATRRHTFAGV